MAQKSKLVTIYEFLNSAESAIVSAKALLNSLDESGQFESASHTVSTEPTEPRMEGNMKIIEGAFDGQNMQGDDQRMYPVPANYASKSKLIPGDRLKLSIAENGGFKYKQIGPVPRREVMGTVSYNDGQYQVMVEGKFYKVLLASITYYKAEVGSKVTVIIPQEGESEWCAIEHLVPN